jgi:hypothetical protein
MNTFRMGLLRERADAIRPELAKAREISEKAEAEHRDLTEQEKAFVEPTLKKREIADGMRQVREDDATMTTIKNEFAGVMGDLSGSSTEAKSRRLSFKGLGAKVATMMLGADGQKALAPSGATIVGQEFVRDPVRPGPGRTVAAGRPADQAAHTSTEYAYLRQTTRTNNAAVVAEGATKPTSVYSVTRVEHSLVVVAHLSEGIPRYWLLDSTALEMFIENELTFGLQVAVEAKMLGDINATSGIQTQA